MSPAPGKPAQLSPSKPERTYTRADLQRLVNATALKVDGTLRAAYRELVLRELRKGFSSRLKDLLKQIDKMPAISGVNLSEDA